MKKYFLIIILLFPVIYSHAQQDITGIIVDADTKETIQFANISLDIDKGTASNKD
jgi:hypothetical protein